MNKFLSACIASAWLLCSACVHHPQHTSSTSNDTLSNPDSTSTPHFPIADILESEILQIDTTPVAIRKFVIAGGHTDSGFIKPAEFHALAMQFVVPEFRNGQFEKEFTETSFIDNATRAATFTYSTTNRDLPLQRVDVVAVPQGSADRVKTVYLERSRVSGDSSVLDKMFWRTGRQFQVISLIRVKGSAPVQRQLVVSWVSGADPGGDNE